DRAERPEGAGNAPHTTYISRGKCIRHQRSENAKPTEADHRDNAEQSHGHAEVLDVRHQHAQRPEARENQQQSPSRPPGISHFPAQAIRVSRYADPADRSGSEWNPANPPGLDQRKPSLFLKVAGHPEQTVIPYGIADESGDDDAPQTFRSPELAPSQRWSGR